MTITRTTGSDRDFAELVRQSDAFYRQMFGDAMDYFDQFNTIDSIEHALIIYNEQMPVACGCIRPFDETSCEIKRMFVLPSHRNQGVGLVVLQELEQWAEELGYQNSVLETSKSLTEAISLYQKSGYRRTENWGPYVEVETSMCFKKAL